MRRTSAPTAVFISFRTTSLGIPAFLMSSLKPRASLPTSSPSLPHTDSLPALTEPSLPRPAQLTASFPYVLLPIKAQLRGSQPEAPALLPGEREKKSKTKHRTISHTEATFRPCSSGMRSISATELEFPRPCCVLRSAVRVTCRDYCHLHCNHVVGLVLRTKTSILSREKGGWKGGEGTCEHTKEPMQSSNHHLLNFH